MLFDLLDDVIAEALEVSVDEYIKRIELPSFEVAEKIINLILTENEQDLAEAKQLFNQYKL